MITHLVFFNLEAEAQGRTAEENIRMLQERLNALPARIPALQSLSCGPVLSSTPASFDFGLWTTFEDADALETYRVHPAHQEVVAFIKEVTTTRAVVDYVS